MAELKIETEKGRVNKSAEQIFDFLTNMNNFEGLFMNEYISNWKSTTNFCTFDVEGAGQVGFILDEKNKPNIVVYKNYGNVQFEYKMTVLIDKITDNESEVGIIFQAEVNPFLKMIVKNPLTNLLNDLIKQINKINF